VVQPGRPLGRERRPAAGEAERRALRVGDDGDAQVLARVQRSPKDAAARLPERKGRLIDVPGGG
jgi:hypothetical protein